MTERAPLRIRQFVLDAQDYEGLAHFWQTLLGWPTVQHWPDERWISITDGTTTLSIQGAADHQPPVWGDPGRPQQAHLDIVVPDMVYERGVEVDERVTASGQGRVSLDNVRYTTCMDDDPDWELKAQSIDLDLRESRGEARRVKLGFQNVPLLPGPNEITVVVTGADTVTTATYLIMVHRGKWISV